MSTVTAPSTVKAVVELLRGNALVLHPDTDALVTALSAYVSTRVDTEFSDAWAKPDGKIYNAITVQGDGGFGPDDVGVRAQGRVLIRCWASYYHVSNEIAALVSRILYPSNADAAGWIASSTKVDGVPPRGISNPQEYQDPAGEYRRAMQMTVTLWYRRMAATA